MNFRGISSGAIETFSLIKLFNVILKFIAIYMGILWPSLHVLSWELSEFVFKLTSQINSKTKFQSFNWKLHKILQIISLETSFKIGFIFKISSYWFIFCMAVIFSKVWKNFISEVSYPGLNSTCISLLTCISFWSDLWLNLWGTNEPFWLQFG